MIRRFDPGLIAAALLPLIGILPTLSPGVIDTADGPLHVQRIFGMSVMLGSGNLWPRWIPYFHLGFGYPIFNFYPPGVFYLGGILVRLGLSATVAFTLVAALAWILGSVGTYRLARRFLPAHAAVLAAMLWSYAPSRLFEVWDQGSLPQMMAAALVPWLFYGIIETAYHPTRRNLLSIALPLAGIILSHQPITFITALYAAPLAVIVPLWANRNTAKAILTRYVHVFGGLMLGGLLVAIFLLPLALELRYVQASRGAQDTVDYLKSNFLQPGEIFMQPQPADLTDLRYELPTTLGLVGGVLAVPGLIVLWRRKQYGLLALLSLAIAFTLFMLVEPSLPMWLTIPFFRQLRFPERFLRIGALLIALAGSASILLLPVRWQQIGLAVGLVIVLLGGLPMAYPNQRFLQWDNLDAEDEIAFEVTNATWGTTSYDEFDPIWGNQIPLPRAAPNQEEYVTNPLRIVVNRVDMARYGDIMQVEEIDTAASRVTLTQEHAVRFHQYFYPGWTATVDGQPAEIVPDEQFGLITVLAPAGEHVIELRYEGTTAQRIGVFVSLVAIAAAIALYVAGHRSTPIPAAENHLSKRTSSAIVGSITAFALLNALVITPNTLLFRYRSAPDAPHYMQTPVNASFGDTFELLGYTWMQDSVAPGGLYSVMLFWQAQRPLDREYRPVVQLVNLNVSEAYGSSEPFFPGGGHTFNGYPLDRFASEIHEFRVFEDAPPTVARVSVQMLDAETGEALRLPDGSDRILLEPPVRIEGSGIPIADRLNVRFGDSLALTCVNVEAADTYTLLMYWHVLQTPPQDFKTFVHGLDAGGEIVQQADAPPLNGNYPPSLWLPGQYLVDSYALPYDASISQFAIGVYTPDDGTRLMAAQNGAPLTDNRLLIPLESAPCQP